MIMARLPISNMDYTTRDYEGFRTLMIQELQKRMPEYTDTRQSDAGIVILELNAMCLDILSYYLDSIANECFLVTAEQRSNILKFCKMLGYIPQYATSAQYSQIFIKTSADTEVIIPQGTKVKTYSTNPDNQVYFTTLKDLVIPKGALGNEVDSETGEYLYAVPVIHGLYVNNEVLTDSSNGEANQTYRLNYAPALIDENFKVYVADAQNSSELWRRVKSFAGSDSSSKVYTVEVNDYNETSVVFGNDIFGKAPKDSSITCSYYVGGGESGNVGIGAIKEMEDNIASIASTQNVKILKTGYNQETVDEIKVNAPIAHRNIWGALTCDDFAGVLKVYFPDVIDAEAKKASEDWTKPEVDDIEIYVLTQVEIEEQIRLQEERESKFFQPLTEDFYNSSERYLSLMGDPDKDNGIIHQFFNSDTDYVEIESGEGLDSGRKLVGMRDIYLKHANFAGLNIEYTLMVRDYYDRDLVSKQIDNYIFNYFALGNIKFNQDISLQDLMYEIVDNSGIEGIRYLSFTIFGDKDENGEIHNDLYSFISHDLLIPEIGTLFVLTGISRHFPEVGKKSNGGGTLYGNT